VPATTAEGEPTLLTRTVQNKKLPLFKIIEMSHEEDPSYKRMTFLANSIVLLKNKLFANEN